MSLTYSQWIWGFEIFDSGANQNNLLDFTRSGAKLATLNAGSYTADELATEIARAMNATDGANSYAAVFSYSTLRFAISGTSSFTLNKNTGSHKSQGPWTLAGFDPSTSDLTGTSLNSDAPAGTAPSTASIWTAAEPLNYASPVSAAGAGTAASFTQRALNTIQHVSDGMTVESVYIGTIKRVAIAFRALIPSEQANMEKFLDWVVQGKRFTWQPDKTSPNVLKLVLVNPGQVNNVFEWLARSETTYGVLTFMEQLS